MSLTRPPPRATRIAVVWPAGPSNLSSKAGDGSNFSSSSVAAAACTTTAVVTSQNTRQSRRGPEQQTVESIKNSGESDPEDMGGDKRNHMPGYVSIEGQSEAWETEAAPLPRPLYHGQQDKRVHGRSIRRRQLSPHRPAAAGGALNNRQAEDHDFYERCGDDNPELMDAIMEDMGRLTVTMKLDDTGRWRILWKSREIEI